MKGETFRQVRIDLGITQDEIAKVIGVNVRTVQRIECSNGEIPRRYMLAMDQIVATHSAEQKTLNQTT